MRVKCIDAKNSFGLVEGQEYDVRSTGESYRLTSLNPGMGDDVALYHSKSRFVAIEPPRTIESMLMRKESGVGCTQEESAQIKAHLRRIEKAFPLEWDEVMAELTMQGDR